MIKKISRLLLGRKGKDAEDNNTIRIEDPCGKTAFISERRKRSRMPFRGRPAMAAEDYHRVSSFITDIVGIKLDSINIHMLESRLMGRLRTLDIANFHEYTGYLMSERGMKNELDNFIDAITTQKTHFYRENDHFDFIIQTATEKLLKTRSSIKAWSVGCSTGEEPYSIAMALMEYGRLNGKVDFSVLGTDVSRYALEKAACAEYAHQSMIHLPQHFIQKYFDKKNDNLYQINNRIQDHVTFRKLNLIDDEYALVGKVDILFLRNVGIYFSPEIQGKILRRLCTQLSHGGYLFIGHSENVKGLDLPVDELGNSIYIRH